MLMEQERKGLVKYGRKLVEANLTSGTGGNLSVYNRDNGTVAITPSGVDYFDTEPDDIVITDINGKVVEGDKRPSSELAFHLAVYQARGDISAVVHTHSVYATTLACMGLELPAVHYMVAFSGRKVPLAPYRTFGTPELAAVTAKYMDGHNAVLLANHGLVAAAGNLPTAFAAAEEIEFAARIYCQAKSMGEPVILPDSEMDRVIEKFKWYGQKKD